MMMEVKLNNIGFWITCVIFLMSCKRDISKTYKAECYNIQIFYEDIFNRRSNKGWENLVSKDSLYLFLEKGFNNDLITIYVNGEKSKEVHVSTDLENGFAGDIILGGLSTISTLSLRMNEGPLVYFEQPEIKFHLFNLNYYKKDDKLVLSVLNNVPFYD